MEEIISAIQNVPAVVSDLDRTLHRSLLSTVIGKAYMRRERLAGRSAAFYRSMFSAAFANTPFLGSKWCLYNKQIPHADARTRSIAKAGGIKWGLRTLFDGLAKMGARRADIYRIAGQHIATAAIEPTHRILREAIADHKRVFLTTTGPDIGPRLYSKKYKIAGWIANPVEYSKGRVSGCQVKVCSHNIVPAIEKMLFHHGLRLSDCAIIADDRYYIPAMRKAAVAIASPSASAVVKAAADFCI